MTDSPIPMSTRESPGCRARCWVRSVHRRCSRANGPGPGQIARRVDRRRSRDSFPGRNHRFPRTAVSLVTARHVSRKPSCQRDRRAPIGLAIQAAGELAAGVASSFLQRAREQVRYEPAERLALPGLELFEFSKDRAVNIERGSHVAIRLYASDVRFLDDLMQPIMEPGLTRFSPVPIPKPAPRVAGLRPQRSGPRLRVPPSCAARRPHRPGPVRSAAARP